jgi:hypothetical protein
MRLEARSTLKKPSIIGYEGGQAFLRIRLIFEKEKGETVKKKK